MCSKQNILNKTYLILTQLYNSDLYNVHCLQNHFLLIGIYQPRNGSITHYADYFENYILKNEGDADNHNDGSLNIAKDIQWYKSYYKRINPIHKYNDVIQNYYNIVSHPNYMQCEIGTIVSYQGYYVVIKKTCWLRIFQKKIKKYLKNKKLKQV